MLHNSELTEPALQPQIKHRGSYTPIFPFPAFGNNSQQEGSGGKKQLKNKEQNVACELPQGDTQMQKDVLNIQELLAAAS